MSAVSKFFGRSCLRKLLIPRKSGSFPFWSGWYEQDWWGPELQDGFGISRQGSGGGGGQCSWGGFSGGRDRSSIRFRRKLPSGWGMYRLYIRSPAYQRSQGTASQKRGSELCHSGCLHGFFQSLHSVPTQIGPQRCQQGLLLLVCPSGCRQPRQLLQHGRIR